jgi:hypothetical protein
MLVILPVTPTSTSVPTATATAAPPTDTPVPAVPTNTPKPARKPTATATTPPAVSGGNANPPPPATPVPPVKLPSTGLGGTGGVFSHNAAMGRVYRAAHGTVALGRSAAPSMGSGASISPIVPILLGILVVGLGVLTRRFAVAPRP